MGKSTGSIIYQGLFFLVPTMTEAAPFVAAVLLVIICAWVGATRLLGQEFNQITRSSSASLAHPVSLEEEQAAKQKTDGSPASIGQELIGQQVT